MNHQRHIVREAIVAVLAAAGTAASTRVYDTPFDPRTEFPALVVSGVSYRVRSVQPNGTGVTTLVLERQ